MTDHTCPDCDSQDAQPVWQETDHYADGGEPDYIRCPDCGVTHRYTG